MPRAPAVFQALISYVLWDILNQFVLVYLDANLIFSNDPEEQIAHLQHVLTRLLVNDFLLKPKSVSFAGTWKELHRLLGFASFYGRFTWDYSKITSPLT